MVGASVVINNLRLVWTFEIDQVQNQSGSPKAKSKKGRLPACLSIKAKLELNSYDIELMKSKAGGAKRSLFLNVTIHHNYFLPWRKTTPYARL